MLHSDLNVIYSIMDERLNKFLALLCVPIIRILPTQRRKAIFGNTERVTARVRPCVWKVDIVTATAAKPDIFG